MNILQAVAKCKALLSVKGLTDWTVEVSQATHGAGSTIFSEKKIWFSEPVIALLDAETVRDVVLHEVAHALSGRFVASHGEHWQAAHRRLGGSGKQYIDVPEGFFERLGK